MKEQETRRSFLPEILIVGAVLIFVAFAFGQRLMILLFRPRLNIQQPEPTFDAGSLAEYREPGVYTQFKKSHGVWIVRQADGRLIALSTVCTHLGCTPEWRPDLNEFKCPCHGSKYDATGVNIKGPTKRPLERYRIVLKKGRVVVDKAEAFRKELGQWKDPDSFINVGQL